VAPPASWWADGALQARLDGAIPDDLGHIAVAARHLRTGATAAIDGDLLMPPASVYKLGVLADTFQLLDAGRLDLDEQLLLTQEDYVGGAGILQGHIGQRVQVGEALTLMVGISDNVAAQALLRRVGVDSLNATYQRLGLARTHYYVDDRPNVTTAADTASLLVQLATGQLAGPAGTQRMLDLLAVDQPQSWIQDGLPPGTIVAHKSGQLPGVRNDAAIVYTPDGPFVLVVLTSDLADEGAGEGLISDLARLAFAYFVSPSATARGLGGPET
jgi:beta-lactamase class A